MYTCLETRYCPGAISKRVFMKLLVRIIKARVQLGNGRISKYVRVALNRRTHGFHKRTGKI